MKFSRILAVVLALMLGASTACAVDSAEVEAAKMQKFYDILIESQLIPDGGTLESRAYQNANGDQGTWYDLADYMYATVTQDSDGVKTYDLSVAVAEVPDRLESEYLHAFFIMALSDQEMTRQEAIEFSSKLNNSTYRSDLYSLVGGLCFNGLMSTALLRFSLTDSEVLLTVKQFPQGDPL